LFKIKNPSFVVIFVLGLLPNLSPAMFQFPSLTPSVIIDYELVSLGGQHYKYSYKITNQPSSSGTAAVKLIDIIFDKTLYNETTLSITTTGVLTTTWTEQLFFSIAGVDPIYEISSTTGLADNTSISGFSIEFDWLGAGIPAEQLFEIRDLNTFTRIEQGKTQTNQAPPVINPPPIIQGTANNVPTLSSWSFLILVFSLVIMVYLSKKLFIVQSVRFK